MSSDPPEKNKLQKEYEEKLNKNKKTQKTKKGKEKGKRTRIKDREETDKKNIVKGYVIEKVRKKILKSDSKF